MFLKMLREAFAQRSRSVRAARGIKEGKDLKEILPEYVEADVELQLESKWWLERFFARVNLSFWQGAFLIYVFVEVPRLLMFPFIVSGAQQSFVMAYSSSFFGEMFIPLSLILIHNVYKSLVAFKTNINETVARNQYVALPILISEKELTSSKLLEELDEDYRNRYVKPAMLRTLQYGLNLSFNKNYQLGSGLIATSIFFLIMFMTFVLNVLPESFFHIWEPGIPGIAIPFKAHFFFTTSFDWFIVGMLTWTLFLTFLSTIQASGNAIKIRPFESTKEYLASYTNLILKTSFTATFIVAWLSPFVFVWSVLPPDPLIRQGVRMFVELILTIMIPVIILSFFIPILMIHKCMTESRKRALLLKKYQLDVLKRKHKSYTARHFKIQAHLIQDYKDIQSESVWLLNFPQVLELTGTVLLPIVTFLISARI